MREVRTGPLAAGAGLLALPPVVRGRWAPLSRPLPRWSKRWCLNTGWIQQHRQWGSVDSGAAALGAAEHRYRCPDHLFQNEVLLHRGASVIRRRRPAASLPIAIDALPVAVCKPQ